MRFENQIELSVPREKVWQFLWDVDRFITCVPGCKEARTVEEGKIYNATMVEKVGPFRVEFPIRIEVEQSEQFSTIKARASGSDSRIGSHMKVVLEVDLKENGSGTLLSFVVSVDILGKLATLGHSMIKRKADQVMREFVESVKKRLEGDS
ncbi:MAG: CoxG family protein [Candidatus Binatia bacterium]